MPTSHPLSPRRSFTPRGRPERHALTHEPSEAPFSSHIKELRLRFGGKQMWMAYVAGCSDAAVSFWESGKRIPADTTLTRIVEALTEAGASPHELATLRRRWLEAKVSRSKAKPGQPYHPHPAAIALVAERKGGR